MATATQAEVKKLLDTLSPGAAKVKLGTLINTLLTEVATLKTKVAALEAA